MNKQKHLPSIKRLKQRAKAIKKAQSIKNSQALNIVANQYGFDRWLDLIEAQNRAMTEIKSTSTLQ